MWYDLGYHPEPGSPLESVYQILFQLRQEAHFVETVMITRAILDAPLQTVEGAKPGTELKDLADQYLKALFPYHEADEKQRMRMLHEKLDEWVKNIDHIQVDVLPSITDQMKAARRKRRSQDMLQRIDKDMSRLVQRKFL